MTEALSIVRVKNMKKLSHYFVIISSLIVFFLWLDSSKIILNHKDTLTFYQLTLPILWSVLWCIGPLMSLSKKIRFRFPKLILSLHIPPYLAMLVGARNASYPYQIFIILLEITTVLAIIKGN